MDRPAEDPVDAAPTEYIRPTSVLHFLATLPQNLLIGFLRIYRKVVSPLYGDVCRYFPTCSAYGLEAVTLHGSVKGSALTMRRLVKCHPWATGGTDPVPPGRRTFGPGEAPKILLLNHPQDADTMTPPLVRG